MRITYEREDDDGRRSREKTYDVTVLVDMATNDGQNVMRTEEILARLIDTLATRGAITADEVDLVVFGFSCSPGRVKGYAPEE